METHSLGFIGGGRITRIFLEAFAKKHQKFDRIMVFDTNPDVLKSLKQQFRAIETAESLQTVARQPIVFISLHPPVIRETLDKIAGEVGENAVVISLAPKITIEKICARLKTAHVARLIPNATSFINEGYNPVSFAAGFGQTEKTGVMQILKLLGNTFEVAESKLEAYAIVSAMLPTYFWFQWNELGKLGVKMGLTESESKESIQQTLVASINLMFQSGLSPEQVIDLIPVKPIAEHEMQIEEIYQTKLLSLFEKIKPVG